MGLLFVSLSPPVIIVLVVILNYVYMMKLYLEVLEHQQRSIEYALACFSNTACEDGLLLTCS